MIRASAICSIRPLQLCFLFLAGPAGGLDVSADEPADVRTIAAIHVQPVQIQLTAIARQQQLLVTGTTTGNEQIDLTRDCTILIADSTVAVADGSRVVGAADGSTKLTVRYGEHSQTIPVDVSALDEFPAVHFENDVVPILSKLSCNSGGCHGKAGGQNGFQLSIFGFDPDSDYGSLVKDARGRRLFPASAEHSLLIRKGAGIVPHGGGRRLPLGSPDYEVLLNWIIQGAPRGTVDSVGVESIDVSPSVRRVSAGAGQQLLVTARFTDGSTRDVTHASTFTSNAEFIAEVDQTGLIQTGDVPGEAAITINYRGFVAATRVLIPRPDALPWQPPGTNNEIDRLVWTKLRSLGIEPSGDVDDAVFLRRLMIKAIGTLPTAREVRQFQQDTAADKRKRLIDSVLERTEYADYWATVWADVLLVDQKSIGPRGAFQFHRWLRSQIDANRPYDEWVQELLVASGSSGKVGPVNFFRAARTADELARSVSQAFLGVRLDCAQCHHHPFDRWGQEDFYGMAGFFSGLKFQKLSDDRELVFHESTRQARMPLTDTAIPIRPPGGPEVASDQVLDPRIELARWMTSQQNPYFARLAANRVWNQLMGRGLVEPIDDLRATNPAANEPLLDYLANYLVENQYDLKSLIRLVLNSQVFQLASETNATNTADTQNFSHYPVTRLPAEVLLDAICAVTEIPEPFAGMPPGTRAIQLWDNRLPSYFLDTFGRSPRESPCVCGRSGDPTMAQALHLMNAPEIESRISHPDGRAARLAASSLSDAEVVDELTLITLGRLPDERERQVAVRLFQTSARRQATEDYLWVLLNSYDFIFVH